MSFNEKLQKLRKANNLSQEGLADLLDVTRQSVSKWESGTTYPEMDKLLAMCKIFKCSLDDLTNDEITDIKTEEKKKNSLYTLIDSILYFLNQTYQTFKVMTRKELSKCIITMGIIIIILFILRLPFSAVENFFKETLYQTHNELLINFGYSIIELLINCAYFALFAIIFIYIFQMLYLDNQTYKMRIISGQVEKENTELEIIAKKEEVPSSIKEPVKKAEHRIESASTTLFHFLGAIIVFVGKSMICFFTLPILVLLFLLCASLFICLFLLFKGVFYISVLIGIPFAILLLLVILEVFFCFVLNRKTNEKRIGIMFLASIIGLGSSFGILLLDISSISYIDEVPEQVKMDTLVRDYEMNEDLYFLFSYNAEYVVDNTLGNTVKVEANYYKDYTNIILPPEVHSSIPYYEQSYAFVNPHLLSVMIDDLSHRKIYNYGYLNEVFIKIYATEENIAVLKSNYEKEQEEIRKRDEEAEENWNNYVDERERYESRITELEGEKEELEKKIENLQSSNEEYKSKLEDYKRRLQEIIEE